MNDLEIRERVHAAIDGGLSHLDVDPLLCQVIIRRTREAGRGRRRIAAGIVLAIALLLAMAAIGIAAARFGILEFNRLQADNGTFMRHILAVDETYENEYLTLTVNDAVFDGTYLSMTMDVRARPGCGEGVYVCQTVTAMCCGEALDVEIVSCFGDFFSGFWVPERDASLASANGQYGAEYSIAAREDDRPVRGACREAVTWTVHFEMIRPRYPLACVDRMLDGDVPEEVWEAYEQRFAQAYRERTILLADGYSPVEYAQNLPTLPDVKEEANWSIPDRLVESGAFERVDSAEIVFVTQETGIRTLSQPQTFDLGEYAATVTKLSVSFGRCDYEIELVRKPGRGKTAGQEYTDGEPRWTLSVLADGCGTWPETSSRGLVSGTREGPGAALRYTGSVTLTGDTDSVTFVFCREEQPEKTAASAKDCRAQRPACAGQETMAFTVKAE